MAFVTFTYNPTPAPACYPPDINGLAAELTSGILVGTIPDTAGGGISVGTTPPSSALTNKVWFKTDGAGRPLGVYLYYNGNWRRMYTGLPGGHVSFYYGSNTVFDGTGRGLVGGDYDGWALANGQNGTPNLEAYFLVGGQWGAANDGSGVTGWVTDTDGRYWRNSGGAKIWQIQSSNLPALHVTEHGYSLEVGTQSPNLKSYVDSPSNSALWNLPVLDAAGNALGTNADMPHPLFYALAYIVFIGYA